MADLKYYDILLKPLTTEKSMKALEGTADRKQESELPPVPKYAFYVHPEATKVQIKEAVEKLFTGTKVESVNTMNCHPKKRQRRGFAPGTTVKRKKALVTLAPGSKEIEVFQGM
jgi:large subunit ribosomal protein L23